MVLEATQLENVNTYAYLAEHTKRHTGVARSVEHGKGQSGISPLPSIADSGHDKRPWTATTSQTRYEHSTNAGERTRMSVQPEMN